MENSQKTCKRGHLVTKDSVYRDNKGWVNQCKLCAKEARSLPQNRAKRAAHEREIRSTAHGIARQVWQDLRKNYNISIVKYLSLLYLQNYKCGICGGVFDLSKITRKGKDRPHVDHKHGSIVRGLLCNYCNVGLGMFRENLIIFSKASNYLLEQKRIKRTA